jgi:acetyl esterase/lipase
LREIRAQGLSGWSFMTIPQMREMMNGLNALAGETEFDGTVEEARISDDVTALIYRQLSAPAAPLILYFHPGGFVAGDAKGIDGCVRRLANATGASVASVNDRLAPEHTFPAALEHPNVLRAATRRVLLSAAGTVRGAARSCGRSRAPAA